MERHGLSSPTATVERMPTGELSPMAFLVGVTGRALDRHPHLDAPNELAPLVSLVVSTGARKRR